MSDRLKVFPTSGSAVRRHGTAIVAALALVVVVVYVSVKSWIEERMYE